MTSAKYVIIGNSAAAIGTVEGIRQADESGSIILISKEPGHTYSRPLISYLLLGKTTEQRMRYREDDFYEKNHCTLMEGRTVTAIDPAQKRVLLDDGSAVGYEKLMYAAGSRPFVPPMEGLDKLPRVHTFMSLEDAHKLQADLSPNARVLIIGAGLIGLKCAEGISQSVGSITVVDLADRILSSILDAEAAAMMQSHLEQHGLSFILGDSVERFETGRAHLKSGRTVDFDLLVVAIGVRPNTDLLKEAGAALNRGITVDSRMRTSLPDIYAAGDCVESDDISCGQTRILALLPNAYRQGECAGINMAGGQDVFDRAIPMNAIGFFGLHIITAGSYAGQCWSSVCAEKQQYKKLFYQDDQLKGYILMGSIEKAGIYTSLIREQIPLSTIDFELICQQPGLMAFTREYRDQALAGAKEE